MRVFFVFVCLLVPRCAGEENVTQVISLQSVSPSPSDFPTVAPSEVLVSTAGQGYLDEPQTPKTKTDTPTMAPNVIPSATPTRSPTVSRIELPILESIETNSPTASSSEEMVKNTTGAAETTEKTIVPTVTPPIDTSAVPTLSPTVKMFTAVPSKAIMTDRPTKSPSGLVASDTENNKASEPTMVPVPISPLTFTPTAPPSTRPTRLPSESPTVLPTRGPTANPTMSPTGLSTAAPTTSPSNSPTVTPSKPLSAAPTSEPTVIPSDFPSTLPSYEPTMKPSDVPSMVPSSTPSTFPTNSPTASPTKSPTASPTPSPTDAPTKSPTIHPTSTPTNSPTSSSMAPNAPTATGSETVAELVAGNSDLRTLEVLLEHTGLFDSLKTTGPFTLFAPTNAAFADIGISVGRRKLQDLDPSVEMTLLYHLVEEDIDPLQAGTYTTEYAGTTLSVEEEADGSFTVNNAANVTGSEDASNGHVYIIDAVLLRPSTPAPAAAPVVTPTAPPVKSPTASPTPLPTDAPTKSPTKSPTVSPTKSPTGSPTASPTDAPTKSPTVSPTSSPTRTPTNSPTGAPTAAPTSAPTTTPTSAPTQSPTGAPSASPTQSPTASPTSSPTSAPTSSPTQSPTVSPTTSPTSAPSASPTSSPTTSPTGAPTTAPTSAPTTTPISSPSGAPSTSPTSQPSVSPSQSPSAHPSTTPTYTFTPTTTAEAGLVDTSARVSVPVRSSVLMDQATIAVFETTTLNFLSEYVPTNDYERVDITSVKVVEQKLEERRRLRYKEDDGMERLNDRKLQQPTNLLIDINVNALYAQDSVVDYPLKEIVEETFERHYRVFESELISASSFFRVGFQAAAVGDGTLTDKSGQTERSSSMIIVASVVAACAALVIGAGVFAYTRRRRAAGLSRELSLSLPSWSSNEMTTTSSNGLIQKQEMDSPTDAEIYSDDRIKISVTSLCCAQQASSISQISESESETSVYRSDDYSVDTDVTNSERYINPQPYSPFTSLATIDETTKMEEIDLATPCSDCTRSDTTPRTRQFFEVKPFSDISKGDHDSCTSPGQARFEDCEVCSPKDAFVNKQNTPRGTQFVQLNTNSALKTGVIMDDLTRLEKSWEGNLDSKVNEVTETPKANNLEKFKKAPRRILYDSKSPQR